MKVLLKDKKHNTLKIVIDDNEDYYYLDKLVNAGDKIKTVSYRKTKKGRKEETVKKKYVIEIVLEQTIFGTNNLRFKGKITWTNSDDVPLGSYHSLTVEQGSKITITKKIVKTDEEILKKAVKTRKTKIALSVIDYGEAHFGILEKNKIRRLGSFEENINEREIKKTENNQKKYLKEYAKKLEELNKQEQPGIIIIGSTGFMNEHVKKIMPDILKKKTHYCKVSNTTQRGLQEIINRDETGKILAEEEVSKETGIINLFFEKIGKKNSKTIYGLKIVKEKTMTGAVETLLISDELLKNEEIRNIIEKNEELSGKIEIISSQHGKGEEFLKFGGIGAFLRY
ncbi:MAG: pelota family protein [Nanoarchaeota archaeon]|nr:pelota family protein [Nanoarchaeota archaeon]